MKLDILACPLCLYGMRVWVGDGVLVGMPNDRKQWRSACNYGRHYSQSSECPHLREAAIAAADRAVLSALHDWGSTPAQDECLMEK
jgi:hypothetical protein